MTVMQIISRADAKAQSLKRFFTGEPCEHGHTAESYTSNGNCIECHRIREGERRKAKRASDPDYVNRANENSRMWKRMKRLTDPRWVEKHNSYLRDRRKNDFDFAERGREYQRAYRIDNPDSKRLSESKRRATKAQATPAWLTKQHHDEMKAIYRQASDIEKMTGIKMHVDHIIPIKGRNATGLHVPWNLRVIAASENLQKNNLVDEDIAQPACVVTVLSTALPRQHQMCYNADRSPLWTQS